MCVHLIFDDERRAIFNERGLFWASFILSFFLWINYINMENDIKLSNLISNYQNGGFI